MSPAAPSPPLGRPVKRRRGRRALGLVCLGLACLGLGLRHSVSYFTITSGSMQPTLQIGARVAVEPGTRTPRVGDIVVFHPPRGADPATPVCGSGGQGSGQPQPCGLGLGQESRTTFTKRVVAGPGDTVALVGGRAVVNGVAQPEAVTVACTDRSHCDFPTPVTVPAGDYYMLGDNRAASDDSRYWGPVPGRWIVGTVVRCSWLQTICRPLR